MLGMPVLSEKERPFVRFQSRLVEDRKETRKQGRIVEKMQHLALVTVPGERSIHPEELPGWWSKLDEQVQAGRMPEQWVDAWKAAFEKYQKGYALPAEGTPIRGWRLVPDTIQDHLIQLNIHTVEALANITDEALAHVGIGAREFKDRAKAWLSQNNDQAGTAIKMAELEQENASLKASVAGLTERVNALVAGQPSGNAKPSRSKS